MIKNTSLSMVKGLFQTYQSLHDPSAHNDPRENLIDLITELMHLADCQGIDARAAHNIALTHYLEERDIQI